MTYNFDPEGWFEREQNILEMKRQRGDLSEEEFADACTQLERRYEEMLDRLDGTYLIGS